MKIDTRVFGSVEIDETQVVRLTDPMPGFSEHTRFVVLDPEPDHPFQWLQAVDRPDLCFLVADPRAFFPDYRVELRSADLTDLGLTEASEAAVAVVVNVPGGDPAEATANLLAPIVFNTRQKRARQVILEGSDHPVRARLFEEVRQVSTAG